MKALSVLFITLTIFGANARAGLLCQTVNPEKASLKLKEPNNTRAYTLVLETAMAKTLFGAIPVKSEPGALYSKTTYSIWGPTGIFGSLIVTEKLFIGRGGCGRGSCDNGIKTIHALLDYNGAKTHFSCEKL